MTWALCVVVAVLMTGWTAVDTARHGRNWLAWGMLAAFTGGIGVIVWLLVLRRADIAPTPLGSGFRVGVFLTAIPLVLVTAAVAAFATTFLLQLARVDGESMAPTLDSHDHVVVNKLAYQVGEPRVGEIVMLRYPLNPDKTFVDRVMAEEGDQIRIVDGRVYRNDVLTADSFVFPEYRSHEDWGPQIIPQGYYFVMGDHRNHSSDSRHWGMVPKKYILGRVQLRWWPPRKIGSM